MLKRVPAFDFAALCVLLVIPLTQSEQMRTEGYLPSEVPVDDYIGLKLALAALIVIYSIGLHAWLAKTGKSFQGIGWLAALLAVWLYRFAVPTVDFLGQF